MWLILLVSCVFFVAYLLLHYVLFLLASYPKDAAGIGHKLNQFERRQLIEWRPKKEDFLKHDDEHRTYDDVFGPYRSETDNYSTCVFPRLPFAHRYASDYLLLNLKDGMQLLDLGCGSGAAAEYFGRRRSVDITCVTNSSIQGEICRGKFQKFGGRLRVVVADFDELSLPDASFDAIYAFESIGYSKDLDAWLARCWRMLKPGGRLLIRSPGSLDFAAAKRIFGVSQRFSKIGATISLAPTSWCSSCASSYFTPSAIATCRSGPGA